jgi:endonuclease/exonuclease/phosphatase (EEP) superfamily protein YafD
VGLLAVLLLALVGQVARDRAVPLALMMYLPLLPLGGAAVALDAVRRGRALPGVRFGLGVVGLAAVAWSVIDLTGRPWRASPANVAPADGFRVIHWNVWWGGGDDRDHSTWAALHAAIAGRTPDIVVLSEAPLQSWLTETCASAGWQFTDFRNAPGDPYMFAMAVCSPWPVTPGALFTLPHGRAMLATVDVRGRPVRVLVVDGISDPTTLRTPLLHEVARIAREHAAAGTPIDVVAGDFNSVARSAGFDALRGEYALASHLAGWRGTYPASCPLYDIDHVWVSGAHVVRSCDTFANPHTNHRGQDVVFTRR